MSRNTAAILVIFAGIGAFLYYAFEQGTQNLFGSVSDAVGGIVDAVTGKLTATQIAQYASAAGFQGEDLATAVAVALAESGGKPSAMGDYGIPASSPGQYNAIGLWQINIAENPQFALWDLTDPAVNAQAAFKIYSQFHSTFNAWSTFNPAWGNQPYLAFLAEAQGAVQNV